MNDKINILLTPSARSAFSEMRIEFEQSLLDKAYEIANSHNTGEAEISLRDIMEARKTISIGSEVYRLRRWSRVANTALIGGFSYVLLGVLFYFSHYGLPILSKAWFFDNLWLLIIIMGLAMMSLPLALNVCRYVRQSPNNYAFKSSDMIVKMWDVIEQKGMQLMDLRGVKMIDNSSMASVYDFLVHEFNSREYIEKINDVFDARNQIVYQQRNLKQEDIDNKLKISQIIIDELEKKIEEYSRPH